MTPRFQFDDAKLAILQHAVPQNLQILRLRLRFGLPQVLTLGQRFRISLELVDEMGQPATISQELLSQWKIHINHEPSRSSAGLSAELKANPLATNSSTKPSRSTWNFDAEFSLSTEMPNQSQDERVEDQDQDFIATTILLQIQTKGRAIADDEETEFHRAFQQFCLHSTWIDADTFALPLQSQVLRVLLPSSSARKREGQDHESTTNSMVSNLCNRVFSISGPLIKLKTMLESPVEGKVITIQENYGDTMGSHIWDASILLSFALYKAGQFPHKYIEQHAQQERRGTHAMLELGAGCGLFAAVYSTLCDSGAQDTENTMIVTERTESLELLRSNLCRNSQGVESGSGKAQKKQIQFLPLVWGTPIDAKANIPRIDTIFAADVLYNWSAHEPLLRTMDEIVHHRRGCGGSAPEDSVSVVIAHKHRDKASSSSVLIEKLLQGDFSTSSSDACHEPSSATGKSCQWANWRVTRAARLGKVDLLRFTRKPGS